TSGLVQVAETSAFLVLMGHGALLRPADLSPQVPVVTTGSRTNAPARNARLTPDSSASNEAVMMFVCRPTPKNTAPLEVETSTYATACASLPDPHECSSYPTTSIGRFNARTAASMGPVPAPWRLTGVPPS